MAHENLNRENRVEGSSNRTFGVIFALAFLVLACWPLVSGAAPRWWAAALAAVFGLVAWLRPGLLARPNALWMKFGILLGKVVSPVALGILFYGVFVPMGALIRLAGKDSLRLKLDPRADSYWIPREPPGPPPDSMKNPF
jgi:hypothetical protein